MITVDPTYEMTIASAYIERLKYYSSAPYNTITKTLHVLQYFILIFIYVYPVTSISMYVTCVSGIFFSEIGVIDILLIRTRIISSTTVSWKGL